MRKLLPLAAATAFVLVGSAQAGNNDGVPGCCSSGGMQAPGFGGGQSGSSGMRDTSNPNSRQDQQKAANIGGNQGMTGGDAYYLAPGPLLSVDPEEVNSTTLFELSRGVNPEGVPVAQEPPRFHSYYPAVPTYTWGQFSDILPR